MVKTMKIFLQFILIILFITSTKSLLSNTSTTSDIEIAGNVSLSYKPNTSFPFWQLWNMTRNTMLYLVTMNSCQSDKPHLLCCQCNEKCIFYGTCCIDNHWGKFADNTTSPTVENYFKFYKEKVNVKKTKEFECANPFPFISPHTKNRVSYYLLVSSCTEGADINDVNSCKSNFDQSPAVYSLDDKYIYKNRFCARCNFVQNFKSVNMEVKCESRQFHSAKLNNMDLLDDLIDCDVVISNQTFVQFEIPLIKCEKERWTNRCNVKNKLSEHCNMFCSVFDPVSLIKNEKASPIEDKGKKDPIMTLSVLIVLAKDPLAEQGYSKISDPCLGIPNGVPDFKEKKCVPFQCPAYYQIDDMKCISVLSIVKDISKSKVYTCLIRKKPTILIGFRKRRREEVLKVIKEISEMYVEEFENFKEDNDLSVLKVKNKREQFLDRFLQESSNFEKILNIIEWFILMPYDPLITNEIEFHRTFPGKRLCADSTVLSTKSEQLTETCRIKHNDTLIDSSNISTTIKVTKQNISQHISICKKFFVEPSCELKTIKGKYKYGMNGELVHTDSKGGIKVFTPDQYVPIGDGFSVCIDDKYGTEIIRHVMGYASLVGHVLSCICHVMVLLTFGLLEDEFPGYGLVSLCGILFLSDLFTLVIITLESSKVHVYSELCKLIAMCLHFLLLSVHACAVVSSIDLFKQLGQAVVLRRSHHTASEFFQHRAIFMFFIPAVIVFGAMLLDSNGIIDTGYGANGVCLFSGWEGRIYFYIVPSIITFLCSIILITYTVYKVSSICRANKKTLHGSGRRHLSIPLIALKLVLTYGISEGLGFIQIRGDDLSEDSQLFNLVFQFLYSVTRAYRGLLIFIIYNCRQSVLSKYKARFSRVRLCFPLDEYFLRDVFSNGGKGSGGSHNPSMIIEDNTQNQQQVGTEVQNHTRKDETLFFETDAVIHSTGTFNDEEMQSSEILRLENIVKLENDDSGVNLGFNETGDCT